MSYFQCIIDRLIPQRKIGAALVINLILSQAGYPTANISGETSARLAYSSALEKCNLQQDKADFYVLIINCVIEAVERLLELVGEPDER